MLTKYDSDKLLQIVNKIISAEKYMSTFPYNDFDSSISLSEAWADFYEWVDDQELQYTERNKGEW